MALVPSILIVDDEPQIRSLLYFTFVRAGFEVGTASSGGDAVGRCTTRTYDVVLSDVRMPGMDGHELRRWIAVNQPETRTVLMSGFDTQGVNSDGSSPSVLVTKPFKAAEVVD